MIKEITNTEDILDVRDVISRFEDLETDLESAHEEGQFMSSFDDWIDNSRDNSDPIHAAFRGMRGVEVQDAIEEFYKLRELLNDLKGYGGDEQWRGDWYPILLIRDSHFRDYAEELAEDIGAINSDAGWPNRCIDWARAARELQVDYSTVEFDGTTYWYR